MRHARNRRDIYSQCERGRADAMSETRIKQESGGRGRSQKALRDRRVRVRAERDTSSGTAGDRILARQTVTSLITGFS